MCDLPQVMELSLISNPVMPHLMFPLHHSVYTASSSQCSRRTSSWVLAMHAAFASPWFATPTYPSLPTSNPFEMQVSRRLQHRSFLITTLPSLLSLDGVTITPEERQAAQASLQDQQVSKESHWLMAHVTYSLFPFLSFRRSWRWSSLHLWLQLFLPN